MQASGLEQGGICRLRPAGCAGAGGELRGSSGAGIATEVGGGVVPVDAEQRHHREQAGRLACLLAQRADTVVRVCCGIPQVLKGKLP